MELKALLTYPIKSQIQYASNEINNNKTFNNKELPSLSKYKLKQIFKKYFISNYEF